jgi:hypothetical protein
MEKVGTKLANLRASKGVSLAKVASAGGWSGASSVQKYFEPDYDQSIRPQIAERLSVTLGPSVLEIAGVEASPDRPSKISEVIAVLRNADIPAEVRTAAAAEMLSRLV